MTPVGRPAETSKMNERRAVSSTGSQASSRAFKKARAPASGDERSRRPVAEDIGTRFLATLASDASCG
jgi:hypothetical protein